jgi:hypothetical protein
MDEGTFIVLASETGSLFDAKVVAYGTDEEVHEFFKGYDLSKNFVVLPVDGSYSVRESVDNLEDVGLTVDDEGHTVIDPDFGQD